jgi:hypothetical protein
MRRSTASAAGAGAPVIRRPEWVDVTSTLRHPSDALGYTAAGAGGGGGAGSSPKSDRSGRGSKRPMFGSSDIRDVALAACPDAHTLR